jgi:hypothetical protein
MSRHVQYDCRGDLQLYAYFTGLCLLFLGIGSIISRAVQPTRLPNPGLAAYEAPAAVASLYPLPRKSYYEGEFVPAPVAALKPSEAAHISPAPTRPADRAERKNRPETSDQNSTKRSASRLRDRQGEVRLAYPGNREYGFNWVW